jgi:prepilin-type N-terminal cleavage/methylation domain-containing protein
MIARRARKKVLAFSLQPSAFACSAFTMVEIAICLAIIGIALVAIIGVLPLGINVQRDNREETLIDQDATVLMENIRNGARGLDDLTNYVYAISNSWRLYDSSGNPTGVGGINGYTYASFYVLTPPYPSAGSPLTNGARIIGLLSTPEYMDSGSGLPLVNLNNGGISNYVVAYVRSLSGSAVEKPPQDNDIIRGDSFSYKLICQNVPEAVNTPPLWQNNQSYNTNAEVYYNGISWRATTSIASGLVNAPGNSPLWAQDSYIQQLTTNLRELRLTFLWPLLPNGGTGNGRQTFRTAVAGQLIQTNVIGQRLYFFQPQSFTNAP